MTDEKNTDIVDAEVIEDTSAPTQAVLDVSFDIHKPFSLKVPVSLWEKMTEEVIAVRIKSLETALVQVNTAMGQLEGNGGRGNSDWGQLEQRKNEVVRQLEHTKTGIQVDDLVFKGKTEGFVEVAVASDWNLSLERHVVVVDGKITRILPKAPV